jgi:hypothetical protein
MAVLPGECWEDVDSRLTAHIGTAAQVAKTVLRATRKVKGQREALKHAERREKEGALAMVCLPLNEASAGVFIHHG